MNRSTEHILQCKQSEPPADASGRIVDLINENGPSKEVWLNNISVVGSCISNCQSETFINWSRYHTLAFIAKHL